MHPPPVLERFEQIHRHLLLILSESDIRALHPCKSTSGINGIRHAAYSHCQDRPEQDALNPKAAGSREEKREGNVHNSLDARNCDHKVHEGETVDNLRPDSVPHIDNGVEPHHQYERPGEPEISAEPKGNEGLERHHEQRRPDGGDRK